MQNELGMRNEKLEIRLCEKEKTEEHNKHKLSEIDH